MEVKKGTGSLRTKSSFGDVQLHIEWASPSVVEGSGQGRGNSGVYLQGRYEIQVLDSFNNETYFNGQAGSFYGHAAPLVNASRPPGQWQSYDIIFISPKPQADGSVKPGSFTVLHNGVLIQHQTPIHGGATTAAEFKGVTPKGPLVLQDLEILQWESRRWEWTVPRPNEHFCNRLLPIPEVQRLLKFRAKA